MISPLLANLYLHYVFDLWAERWRRREARGDMIVVRYADDLVVGFEHALVGRVRICAGGGQQWPSLPRYAEQSSGGGKGAQFKAGAIRSDGPGDWETYQLR